MALNFYYFPETGERDLSKMVIKTKSLNAGRRNLYTHSFSLGQVMTMQCSVVQDNILTVLIASRYFTARESV